MPRPPSSQASSVCESFSHYGLMHRAHRPLGFMAWGAGGRGKTPFRSFPELARLALDLGKLNAFQLSTLRHLHTEISCENQSFTSERGLGTAISRRFRVQSACVGAHLIVFGPPPAWAHVAAPRAPVPAPSQGHATFNNRQFQTH